MLRFTLYLESCICVPSPQSIKKLSSGVCKTWAVGFLSKAGIAELFPSIVNASNLFGFVFIILSYYGISQLKLLKTVKALEALLTLDSGLPTYHYYSSLKKSLSISSICKISHASLSVGVIFISSSSSLLSNNCTTSFCRAQITKEQSFS